MNASADSPSRSPLTKYDTISFASASIAVNVHASPAPSGAAFSTFFCTGALMVGLEISPDRLI